MNYLISQMRDCITEFEYEGRGDQHEARRLRLLMLETLSRLALALAIDEVTRPDNYLVYLTEEQMETQKMKIKEFFALGGSKRVRGTLGDYLCSAEKLLKVFDERNCPESVGYILDLVTQTKDLVFDRNIDGHERADYVDLKIIERIIEICDGINSIENPYLKGDDSSLINIYPHRFVTSSLGEIEYSAMARGMCLKGRQISKRALLRMPEDNSATDVETASRKDVMAPIALHESALYMEITLPSGKTRLHLLSPLIAFLPKEKQFGIYHRRQNTWFQASVYIRVSGTKVLDVDPSWDTKTLVNIGREENLESIFWEGELFAHESPNESPTYSETSDFTTDNGILKCSINARRLMKSETYPGYWNVLYLDKDNYFNVPIYDEKTLMQLYRMFDVKKPISNPLYVCGQGGVGKTHTVLHTLREKFLDATVLSGQSMRFRYIIFLTAKQISFNATNLNSAVSRSASSDFKTGDEALRKILTILRDKEAQENETDLLVREIRSITQNPMLIIIDDLDSVVAPREYADSEMRRKENYKEQCRLVEALQEIVRDNDNCRIIVTTRRPLNEVSALHLVSMNDEQSLSFARGYNEWCTKALQMPIQYNAVVKKYGKGIPAYVMRIVYLLNHKNDYSFSDAQIQKFKKDVAEFSLYTTELSNTGIWLFKTIEILSNMLMAIPIGLLRIILFDEKDEEIDDAKNEMDKWDMIEIHDGNMISLRDDSQLLWNQLDNENLLLEQHSIVIRALLNERELLGDFVTRVGELLLCVFRHINDKLSDEQKLSFALRVRALKKERNPFLTGIVPQQSIAIDRWLDIWGATIAQKHTEKHVSPVYDSSNATVKGWINKLIEEQWSIDTAHSLLQCFSEADDFNGELCMLWEQVVRILPECMKKALTEDAIDEYDSRELIEIADKINTKYKEITGKDLSEYFGDLL